ncbi:sensor histidine kinase [Granulosicoccus antarcticus]|uniref:histidine kinase n=1 Tax=Granulosicoccus antarcticus IMCC3135 TaxID=1192854 RepID=A0A2Z2P0L8_9GAMM|nr:HAMP domain-containing sensor histidine kinase [Granulosicoccus antarcticus]ASJ75668.1 Signal transduction histidine-protein kinase/phosphatase MprB [Granulosicoccus antarcticus IMCC3135]
MPLRNVLSGAAFKTALWSLLAFLMTLFLTGFAVYRMVETAMYDELAEQMVEEVMLFEQIEQEGGKQALITAIGSLESPAAGYYRLLGLFDSDGNHLAGNSQIAPDFIGWQSVTLSALMPAKNGEYYSHVMTLKNSTLVIGRNTQFITSVLNRFQRYMLIAGIAVLISTIVLGYTLSHRVNSKLGRMTNTLDAVARGDMDARLEIGSGNDQIDRASRQINLHLEQLEGLMKSTRNTIQAIAHDVRTPLNRAFLQLQDSLQNPALDEPRQQQLEEAVGELENVSEIFDTVLRISKIAASHNNQNFTVFPIGPFLQDIVDLFEPVAESNAQSLSCSLDSSGSANIQGDKRMLRQMMVNLVENAICHCPKGAHITLAATMSSTKNPGIVVVDDGPGIPLEKTAQVLEPFYRLDASRSSPGSGLGLALVDAIANRHQAQLRLEDNQPGLRVSVIFPALSNSH